MEFCVQACSPYFKNPEASNKFDGIIVKFFVWTDCLKLISLEQCRLRGDFIETYKILRGKPGREH